MKKRIRLSIYVLLILSLSACGKDKDEASTEVSSEHIASEGDSVNTPMDAEEETEEEKTEEYSVKPAPATVEGRPEDTEMRR